MSINGRQLLHRSAAGLAALPLSQAFPGLALADTQFVRIGSGFGGTYVVFCSKLAELLNETVPDVRASTIAGGTEQNLVLVQQGEAEMSICYTFHSDLVSRGGGELGVATPDLRHVISLYGSYFVPFMQKNTQMEDLSDTPEARARVWLSSKSSVLWVLNRTALEAYDVTLDDLTAAGGIVDTTAFGNVAQSFQDGQLDVAFMSGPQPYAIIMQVDETVGFKPVSFSEEAGRKFTELLPGTEMGTVPGGTYASQPEDIHVPYVFNHLVANASTPDEVVYNTVKLVFERHAEFNDLFAGADDIKPENALRLNVLPIHPAAEVFYKEQGLL